MRVQRLIPIAWAIPALFAAVETYTFWRLGGRNYPFWRAAAMESPAWMVYAALTPLIFRLGKRLPLERPHFARNFFAHLLAALIAGLGYVTVATFFSLNFSPIPSSRGFGQMAFMWFLSALPLTTLAYFCTVGVGSAITHFTTARRQEVDLAEARLAALRMQLHPHFLFNTLNAITVLARDGENATVVRMLTLLSDLLRDVLRTDRGGEIRLEDELAFARRYLDIETIRFADRLTVHEDIDVALLDAKVPTFVLQPLIENALRHGVAPKASGGRVTIGARMIGEQIELSVEDDGVGLSLPVKYGVGLTNTAARLRELFGDDASLVVNGATRATVLMPLRT
ncbi:MAG: histidine kinase [Gemmatimonadaceae bacterium]